MLTRRKPRSMRWLHCAGMRCLICYVRRHYECYSDEHYLPVTLAFHGKADETDCLGYTTDVQWAAWGGPHPVAYNASDITAQNILSMRKPTKCDPAAALKCASKPFMAKVYVIAHGIQYNLLDVLLRFLGYPDLAHEPVQAVQLHVCEGRQHAVNRAVRGGQPLEPPARAQGVPALCPEVYEPHCCRGESCMLTLMPDMCMHTPGYNKIDGHFSCSVQRKSVS